MFPLCRRDSPESDALSSYTLRAMRSVPCDPRRSSRSRYGTQTAAMPEPLWVRQNDERRFGVDVEEGARARSGREDG